jgi:hypothetical protein
MGNWRWQVKVNHLLKGDDSSPEGMIAELRVFYSACKEHVCFRHLDLSKEIAELSDLPEWVVEAAVNALLDRIYDFADENRIWLGL